MSWQRYSDVSISKTILLLLIKSKTCFCESLTFNKKNSSFFNLDNFYWKIWRQHKLYYVSENLLFYIICSYETYVITIHDMKENELRSTYFYWIHHRLQTLALHIAHNILIDTLFKPKESTWKNSHYIMYWKVGNFKWIPIIAYYL